MIHFGGLCASLTMLPVEVVMMSRAAASFEVARDDGLSNFLPTIES